MEDPDQVEILLVEDSPTDAELCIRSLKHNNLSNKLMWVKDGEEALDFLLARGPYATRDIKIRPKVVLLDLRLPKVEGLEVLRKVKADENTDNIPMVILSSSKENRDMVESYKLGVNSYVIKPVEFDDFAHVIAQLGTYWLQINRVPA